LVVTDSERVDSTDVHACTDKLRAAFALHGITLPSLDVDLLSYAGRSMPPLVSLGAGNMRTAHALAAVLRKAAGGE
jgi:hypothetical protein